MKHGGRAMKHGILVMIASAMCASSSQAGNLYLGWADEFLEGIVTCNTATSTCSIRNYWKGPSWIDAGVNDGGATPQWSYLGQQTNAGRTNAKAKVMVRYRQVSDTSSYSPVTVTITRFRRTAVPAEGSTCDNSADGIVSSSSQTYDSTGLNPDDHKINNRMLPVRDFVAETASGGTTIGYRDNLAVNAGGGMTAAYNHNGCYKIKWN